VRESDVIVLSVKPQHLPIVLKQVNRESWSNKVIISVIAGIRTSTLSSLMPNAEIYRAMPNINALVGILQLLKEEGEGKSDVERIFKSLGSVYWVPEDMLDAWTALIGPAFVSEIIDAFALGAVAYGMPRDLAYNSILDTIEGTVKMLRN